MATIDNIIEVSDLDACNQKVGWDAEYRLLKPGNFKSKFFSGKASTISFTQEHISAPVIEVLATSPADSLSLLIRRPSHGELRINGIRIDNNDAIILMPNMEIFAHTKSNVVVDTYQIPISQVSRVANAIGHEWNPLKLESISKLQNENSMLTKFMHELDFTLFGSLLEQESSLASMDDALALLVRWLCQYQGDDSAKIQQDARINKVKFLNSLDFIEENYLDKLSVTQICDYTKLEIKSLEREFIREVGVFPSTYIKAKRLNKIYRALLELEKKHNNVTDIATKFGITHLGRFSQEYFNLFDELPSMTLKRQQLMSI